MFDMFLVLAVALPIASILIIGPISVISAIVLIIVKNKNKKKNKEN